MIEQIWQVVADHWLAVLLVWAGSAALVLAFLAGALSVSRGPARPLGMLESRDEDRDLMIGSEAAVRSMPDPQPVPRITPLASGVQQHDGPGGVVSSYWAESESMRDWYGMQTDRIVRAFEREMHARTPEPDSAPTQPLYAPLRHSMPIAPPDTGPTCDSGL